MLLIVGKIEIVMINIQLELSHVYNEVLISI